MALALVAAGALALFARPYQQRALENAETVRNAVPRAQRNPTYDQVAIRKDPVPRVPKAQNVPGVALRIKKPVPRNVGSRMQVSCRLP